MAQPSNTFDTYDAVGIREDLADVIYNISPTETPFMTNAAKGTATNSLHEWQTDGLRAAANNFQIEGDDYGGTAIIPTDRLNNRTQISAEAIIISGTDRSVDNAGRGDELAYQLAKVGKSLKRDMEVGMVGVEQAKLRFNHLSSQSKGYLLYLINEKFIENIFNYYNYICMHFT